MSFGGNFGSSFMGPGNNLAPQGPYGCWPGCGCSSFFIMMALILLLFGGCLRSLGF